MQDLQRFYDQELGAKFSNALPGIRQRIGRTPFAKHSTDYGVAGNTFRAFRNLPVKPSHVYRQWAEAKCNTIDPASLAEEIGHSEGFITFHSSLAVDLRAFWQDLQGVNLSTAHQYKLIDLFIKWLSEHDFGHDALNEALICNANCALDSQTLRTLNRCISFALPIKNPSMGDIHSGVTYDFCQQLIGDFAKNFGGTRLLFDYFAWKYGSKD